MSLPKYGVLAGTFNRFEKESPNDYGQWYHGFVYVNANNKVFECAVDVNSPTGDFEYMMLGGLDKGCSAMFRRWTMAIMRWFATMPRVP